MSLIDYFKSFLRKQPKSSFRLKSCPKRYTLDQDKTIKPGETVKKALAYLSKRYDLSNVRIERRKDAIAGAYSFSSISDQLQASGKGLTPEQSQASAIMEFTERYSWLHYDYEKAYGYTIKTFNEIKKGNIPTVDQSWFLCNYIGLGEKEKEILTEEIREIPLKWVKGVSLTDYREFYYPLNWYNYVFTSNGLATGNAMEEAIVQALCETIERENVYRFFADKREGNDIDQNSIDNPFISKVLKNGQASGIKFIIKDITLDFKVPTIIVQGTDDAAKDKLTHKGCGYGTHPDPEKALIRALSEYFEGYSLMHNLQQQLDIDLAMVIKRMPEKNFGFLNRYHTEMFNKGQKVLKINEVPSISKKDIKDEIEYIVRVLRRYGYKVVFINKTHPELNIPVPRIFVPGFRNLIVSEFRDPYFAVSEAYHEAGNLEASAKYLKKSLAKTSFHIPELMQYADPAKTFKKDYKETLLFYGGIKKDMVDILKDFIALKGLKLS